MTGKLVLAGLAVLGMSFGAAVYAGPACCAKTAEKAAAAGKVEAVGPQWVLGTQAWTFKEYTFFETVDKAKELGLSYIEVFPGQKLSADLGDAALHHTMSVANMAKVKNRLDAAGLKVLAYGVLSEGNDEAEWRKIFDFCKVMGIICINIEPPQEALPMIDKLANEYQIKTAIHNHPAPSRYWNPDIVSDALKDRSPMMGVCADTGHWLRSGLNPIDCLKKLEGRIYWSHLKDLNMKAPDAHDVPWGSGVANIKDVLKEFYRQGFAGGISVEHEHNWTSSMPEIAKGVAFFREVTKELTAAAKDDMGK